MNTRGRGRGQRRYLGLKRSNVQLDPSVLIDRRFAMQPLPTTSASNQNGHQGASSARYGFGNYAPSSTYRSYQGNQYPQDARHFCDRCFRGYNSECYFQMHLNNHVKCIAEGCTFEALPRVVAKHLLTFHAVHGSTSTSATSATTSWVQSRKRNYPSLDTVEEKKQRHEARMERGDVLETKNAFGKFKLISVDKRDDGQSNGQRPQDVPAISDGDDTTSKRPRIEGTTELIERLLADEIRHERNVLLQCIRHVINHGREFGLQDMEQKPAGHC